MRMPKARFYALRGRIHEYAMRAPLTDVRAVVADVALRERAGLPVKAIRARSGGSIFERTSARARRERLAVLAVLVLDRAAACSRLHGAVAQDAERTYGDNGPLISGSVRQHFPDEVKDRLRRLARGASGSAFAFALWRAAGRTRETYRREHDLRAFGFYG